MNCRTRLPVTAVALTRDDKTAFAVSKDGSLIELDIQTGTRRAALALLPCPCACSRDNFGTALEAMRDDMPTVACIEMWCQSRC